MDPSGSRRPLKRQRVDAYPRGSVMKVEVCNFMTYKEATIIPGPKLNLVLGPNGTGKSSLVCAICVGLAGRTNLLGRAEDVSSFVRRGSQSGWVQITLSSGDPMRPHVVRREIFADKNQSNWRVNGREAREKDVKELVRDKLKVQLDNLCQFLPQDKVVEFARMKPVDLLEATEKAIGNGELYDQHKKLIEVRKELADHDAHKGAVAADLDRLRAENERNIGDVRRIQQRERLLEEVELARNKLPWAEFQERRKKYEEDKQRRDEARAHLQHLQHAQQEDEGPLQERQQLLAELKAEKQQVEGEVRAAEVRLLGGAAAGAGGGRGRGGQQQQQEGVEEAMMAALDDIQAKNAELQGLEAQAAAREKKIADLERGVGELEGLVAALPPPGDAGEWAAQRHQLQLEQRDVQAQASSLGMQVDDLRGTRDELERQKRAAEEKLRRIDDSKLQRLQALEQRYRGIFAAWQWVQANRARFKGPVYGPIAVEVECPDRQHVQYLEQQVAAQTWAFFVTQFREDQDLLMQECRARTGFRPSIANYAGDLSGDIQHPRGEASDYARYGITQTLDKVFTAPNIVKRVLCDEARIHEAYIGGRNTRVEELFREQDRVQMVWTPDCSYKRTRSMYNRAAESTLVGELRPARLLAGSGTADDARDKQAAQAEIAHCNHELQKVQQQMGEVEGQKRAKDARVDALGAELRRVQDEIKAQQQRHQDLRTKLKGRQNELERLRKQADPRRRGPKLRRELQAARDKAFSKAVELAQLLSTQAERFARLAELDLAAREASMQCDRIKEASKARQAELRKWQALAEQLAALVKKSAEECRQLKVRAEAAAPATEELQQRWEQLPGTRAELVALIELKSGEADAMLIQNPAALRQYNDRCRQIAEREGELARLEESRLLARQTIDHLTSTWLPELKRIVEGVSATFSTNFARVGCAGEVALHEAPGEDFEHYAIEIRVKFRDNEQLQTLDANRQSGGERSVSTIMYLIALQGVTVTPFRVVDEINQGMDPVNERKVFMQLVQAACRDGTPQCFLLTPKLLPDLPFTPDVTVLQIMNGRHIQQVATTFSLDKLLGSRRMAAVAAA